MKGVKASGTTEFECSWGFDVAEVFFPRRGCKGFS